MSASLIKQPSPRTLDARRRVTARILAGLIALQLVSPAWAQSYQVRIPANISPEALLPELVSSAQQIDFGNVLIGDTALERITLTNKSTRSAALSFSSVGAPYAFSHDCVNPLPGGQNCSLNFTFSPTTGGAQAQEHFSVSGGRSPLRIELSGAGSLPLAAMGEFTPSTTSDFGSISYGGSAVRSFVFRNIGQHTSEGVYATITESEGLSLVDNSCGSPASPQRVFAGQTCTVTVGYGGNYNTRLASANITIAGGFSNSPLSVGLSGMLGTFNAAGAWSKVPGSISHPGSDYLNFGSITQGQTIKRDIYLNNTGTNGSLKSAFELNGDIAHFKIESILRSQVDGWVFEKGDCGAVVSNEGSSSTACLAHDPSAPTPYKQIRVRLVYSPTSAGDHSVSLRAIDGGNGSLVPEQALTLTGKSLFNANGAWSTEPGSIAPVSTAYLNFGSRGVGQLTTKSVYLNNTGTNGALQSAFEIIGDVDQFKIESVLRSQIDGWVFENGACGAVISNNGASASACLAQDPAIGSSFKQIRVRITHAPTRAGAASITLRAIAGGNGSVVPNTGLVFTGTGF